jgi:hypothetical protein
VGKADVGLEVLALGVMCFFIALILAVLLYLRTNLTIPHW